MADRKEQSAEENVPCEVCLKVIPVSEAVNEEADDYVRHFCGLDCYTKWRLQNTTDENK
ncbi:DUF3330 domain-containing protein [Sulfuriflexus mobilis]|uniref:DUF3330 domain-containing protein n=1 Tax=Sulfuriflexus mobilis TaxID=1811807 RepID=UPI000F817696|nr:DUF3330 domain-containing protein [Sulfuriflexus mobilis]